jgi:hypothetical protein
MKHEKKFAEFFDNKLIFNLVTAEVPHIGECWDFSYDIDFPVFFFLIFDFLNYNSRTPPPPPPHPSANLAEGLQAS